jgi:hypothetical protein
VYLLLRITKVVFQGKPVVMKPAAKKKKGGSPQCQVRCIMEVFFPDNLHLGKWFESRKQDPPDQEKDDDEEKKVYENLGK